ncbi:sugar fermentation stimulation protein SfsA [Rhodoplanes elegans]|uniref:Sugar fermentation stimulation protein homolog n=1 Tax=Rhodoplanes elegans TaxID=29408 RepID=A0A327KN37_9BRAD|nr:DNA/RNA nuclease SfsA [Rhodoplanes elegans]MBK5961780.1 sugar fermentation stimulation protein SfsA [Rhodoplanes elegans]RAI40279.1 DNA/RNA nuclease SfsA [Rhodoplanes elegans]
MRFSSPLSPAILLRRYKRFLADVELLDGTVVTAHVANPGSMLGLAEPGARVWLSRSDNPARKLVHSWELVEVDLGAGLELVGVNTAHPNGIVADAIAAGRIPPLAGYATLRREVKYGAASRCDLLLEDAGKPPCWVEIKSVTLMRRLGLAEFPDATTARGARHLSELAARVAAGERAVMLFLVQIGSAERVDVARDIDPAYGLAFDRARAAGVEAIALRCRVSLDGIDVDAPVPVAPPRAGTAATAVAAVRAASRRAARSG